MRKIEIAFDMDGVIADFEKQANNYGHDIAGLNASAEDLCEQRQAAKAAFYEKLVEYGEEFWVNIPLMEGAREMWEYANELADNVHVITAVPKVVPVEGEAGKRVWLNKQFGFVAEESNFVACRSKDKQKYINRFDSDLCVLIDDRQANCERWAEAGGLAIHYQNPEQAMAALKAVLLGL